MITRTRTPTRTHAVAARAGRVSNGGDVTLDTIGRFEYVLSDCDADIGVRAPLHTLYSSVPGSSTVACARAYTHVTRMHARMFFIHTHTHTRTLSPNACASMFFMLSALVPFAVTNSSLMRCLPAYDIRHTRDRTHATHARMNTTRHAHDCNALLTNVKVP
jgi:hypothetical protein